MAKNLISSDTVEVKTQGDNIFLDSPSDVVESGSNSNGNYIKYSDGTMIQYGYYIISNLAFTSSTPSYSAAQSHTLPIAFYNNKYGVSVSSVTSSLSWIGNINPSATSFSFVVLQNNATTRNVTITWSAIGRWK